MNLATNYTSKPNYALQESTLRGAFSRLVIARKKPSTVPVNQNPRKISCYLTLFELLA